MENRKTICVSTKLTPHIRDLLQKVCEAQGLSESEYLRQLVVQELTRLSLISTHIEKIKEEIRNE